MNEQIKETDTESVISEQVIAQKPIEDHESFVRNFEIYYNLSEEERLYVVTRWDFENGLEGPLIRLKKKEESPKVLKRRKIYSYLLVIGVLIAGSIFLNDYENARYARKKLAYIYDRSLERTPLAAELKQIDDGLQAAGDTERDDESDSGLRPAF